MNRVQAVAFAALTAFAGSVHGPALAESKVTPMLKKMLEGVADKEANVVLFDVDPGWVTAHHIHPGELFVYVLEGGLRLEVDGQEAVEYRAGEVFYEVPNIGMVGSNLSTTERAKFIVFQVGEPGKPIMIAQ